MRPSVALAGLLVLAACSGIHTAERQLRAGARVDLDGLRVLRGGRLRDLQGQRVMVSRFAVDVTEVTVAAYRRCLAAGACQRDPARSPRGCNLERLDVERHPVNCVSVAEAEDFCRWRGARLPTIHEWQWAAQGRGLARRYVWGRYPARRRAHWLNGFEPFVCAGSPDPASSARTCTVGRHDRTRDGLRDLGGNVSEWVHDPAAHESFAVGQSFDYPLVSTRYLNSGPHGPAEDSVRETLLRARSPQYRNRQPDPTVGFRCVRDLGESAA